MSGPDPGRAGALRIGADAWARLLAHAREGYPHEVVGILAGVAGSAAQAGSAGSAGSGGSASSAGSGGSAGVAGRQATRAEPLINERADTANRYRVDGWTLARRERALEREGLAILGYYHTHPDHPARPSAEDLAHALPSMSYVIVSVREGEPAEARSYRLREDRAALDEEALLLP